LSFLKTIVTGGLSIYGSIIPTPKAYSILAYHRISENVPLNLGPVGYMFHSKETFESQMKWALENGVVITLEELGDRIKSHTKPDKLYIAVTFDDGYSDVLENGLPILKKYNIPATLFVSTGFIDNPKLIPRWDKVAFISKKLNKEIKVKYGNGQEQYDLTTDEESYRFIIEFLQSYKGNSPSVAVDLDKQLNRLLEESGYPDVENDFARWDVLKNATDSGLISVGGHTVTHPILAKEGLTEIAEGREILEEKLGVEVNAFAYPFGTSKEVSKESVIAVIDAGFTCAVTTTSGYNNELADRYLLRRINSTNIPNISKFENEFKYANMRGVILGVRSQLKAINN